MLRVGDFVIAKEPIFANLGVGVVIDCHDWGSTRALKVKFFNYNYTLPSHFHGFYNHDCILVEKSKLIVELF